MIVTVPSDLDGYVWNTDREPGPVYAPGNHHTWICVFCGRPVQQESGRCALVGWTEVGWLHLDE